MKRPYIPLLLGLIICLGFFVRIYRIETNPAGFFCDEASIGYNAYTLLTTGKDEHGTPVPVFFQSFGDYRPPIPFYTAIPFVAAFGLSEWSVRLTTAMIGTLTICILFFFLKKLFENSGWKKYASAGGIIGAALLAISPWHIHFSRFGSEYIYLPFFVLLASCCFLEGIRHRYMLVVASVISIGICYTYLPGVVIGPLFFLCALLITFFSAKHATHAIVIGLLTGIIALLPVLHAWQNQTLQTRWKNVGLEKQMSRSAQIQLFSRQYISHFSPVFLFTKGDVDYPGHFITRFGIRNQGQLYILDCVFVLLGIYISVILVKTYPVMLFPLLILMLYPIGSSITTTDGGGPLAFRSVLGSVAFPIMTSIGLLWLFTQIRRKTLQQLFGTCIVIGYILLFGRYLYLYHTHYPLYSQNFWGWQYGPREVMKTFIEKQGVYDEYLFIGEFNAPDIFIRFYDPTNICQNKCRIASTTDITPTSNQLIAISPQSLAQTPSLRLQIQTTILYPNGTPAYYIGTAP